MKEIKDTIRVELAKLCKVNRWGEGLVTDALVSSIETKAKERVVETLPKIMRQVVTTNSVLLALRESSVQPKRRETKASGSDELVSINIFADGKARAELDTASSASVSNTASRKGATGSEKGGIQDG